MPRHLSGIGMCRSRFMTRGEGWAAGNSTPGIRILLRLHMLHPPRLDSLVANILGIAG